MEGLGFFAKFFKGTFRVFFLTWISQAEEETKGRVFSESDKPALREAKEQTVSVAFSSLRAIVNEKMS